ncbi:norsolorinic acid reductase [Colletotrichum asianum]|uniref:Norsolorinic acid reductase n=1 Tax=Colletotrichum asianum TaxID=702518 RepID=A0A8H3WA33_9PEZI|nr:norsolorinic acid reductase [Colletotrichum asianum]
MAPQLQFALDSPLARHRQFSPTAAIRVSPIVLGAMSFGDNFKERMGECTKETAFAIMDHYYSQGGNFIDTANNYQLGQSEEWVAEWLASRGNRDDIVLATKYSSAYMTHDKQRLQSNYGGNSIKSLKHSVEKSLKALQTSYIDILYLYWWDYSASVPEVMHSLNDLVVSGKVHYLGISDTPAWVVAKANQYARLVGLRQFVVYQGNWNASLRDFEREIIPMCMSEGMGICPWGVLNAGRFQTEEGFKEREKHNSGRQNTASEHHKKVSKALERVENAKGASLTDVALAYVMHKAPFVFPIVGGRKLSHIEGNIKGLGTSLTEVDIQTIERSHDFDPGFPHTFLSGTSLLGGLARGAYHPGDVWLTKLMGKFDWVEAPQAITPKTS